MKQGNSGGRFCVHVNLQWYSLLCAAFENEEVFLTKILEEVKALAEWMIEHEENAPEGTATVFGSVASKIGLYVVKLHFYVEDEKNRGHLYTKQAWTQALFSIRRLIIDCCPRETVSMLPAEVGQLAW